MYIPDSNGNYPEVGIQNEGNSRHRVRTGDTVLFRIAPRAALYQGPEYRLFPARPVKCRNLSAYGNIRLASPTQTRG